MVLAILAAACEQRFAQVQSEPESSPIPVVPWQQADLQNGWLAKTLLLGDVKGVDGEDLGVVDGILVGEDRTIAWLTIDTGTLLNLGSSKISVPWTAVRPVSGMAEIVVDASEAGMPRDERSSDDADRTYPLWDVTGLLEDRSDLYGYIDDILFDRQGRLVALIAP